MAAAESGVAARYLHQDYLTYRDTERYDVIIMIMRDYSAMVPDARRRLLGVVRERLHSRPAHCGAERGRTRSRRDTRRRRRSFIRPRCIPIRCHFPSPAISGWRDGSRPVPSSSVVEPVRDNRTDTYGSGKARDAVTTARVSPGMKLDPAGGRTGLQRLFSDEFSTRGVFSLLGSFQDESPHPRSRELILLTAAPVSRMPGTVPTVPRPYCGEPAPQPW